MSNRPAPDRRGVILPGEEERQLAQNHAPGERRCLKSNRDSPAMSAYRDADDIDDDDEWDDEGAFETDAEDSGDEPTVPCPYCRRKIFEDSPRCPYCERYVSAEDHVGPRRPVWVLVTSLICLGMAVWWLFAAF